MADRTKPTDNERDRRAEQLARELTMAKIQVEPWYLDVRGEIVQPDQVAVQTKYFWTRWAPKLGPLATCLLLRLRQYCYYNRATGEKRDWCYPSQETLGEELGAHRETVGIALKRLEVLGFVRREAQYRYDAVARRSVRTTDKYFILMEDLIAPEDEPQAFVLAAQRMLVAEPKPIVGQRDGHKSENPTYGPTPGDNPPRMSENPTHDAVGKPDRKSYLGEVLKNVNVATRTKEQLLHTADMAQQMLEQLGDRHSMGFYRKVAQRVPSEVVYRALSESKEARHGGEVLNAGAYFTARVKQLASEQGIKL
jgi:DNA-binding Lrp family transcriptional regulator